MLLVKSSYGGKTINQKYKLCEWKKVEIGETYLIDYKVTAVLPGFHPHKVLSFMIVFQVCEQLGHCDPA